MELDIKEAINKKEVSALRSLTERITEHGSVFGAVGIWKGHSASIIGRRAAQLDGRLYCIDHWQGNEGTGNVYEIRDNDIYGIYESNMKALGLWEVIRTMKVDSLTASGEFANESIGFLFLDADHRYTQFKEDLEAWLPKIKVGGIICGHDCEQKYIGSPLSLQRRFLGNREKDFDGNYHAGIIMGLHYYFRDNYDIMPNTRIWVKVK